MVRRIDWRIPVGAEETGALFERAGAAASTVFVCAHGAGGRMDDRGMARLAAALVARGVSLVRFNFLYSEKGSRRADPMPRLRACYEAVVAEVRTRLAPQRLVAGGRSMGGRVASMMAADGFPCHGLLLIAYPLHPAGQPEKLRDAHLPRIRVPVLCINGTRDALCRRDLMERALTTVHTPWTMHWIEGGDHSLAAAKALEETSAAAAGWLLSQERK